MATVLLLRRLSGAVGESPDVVSVWLIAVLMVLLAERGVRLFPLGRAERYTHLIAGLAILGSGLAIQFLGM